MARQDVAAIYRWILDDVISKMKPDFVQEGVEELVLLELRSSWENKLLEAGLLDNGEDAPADTEQPLLPLPTASAVAEEPPGMSAILKVENGDGSEEARKRKATGDAVEEPASKQERLLFDPSASAPIPQVDGNGEYYDEDTQDDGEDDLGDLSSDSSEARDDDESIGNVLCALFDKVTRTKNRWKATMKSGVFHINGKDYLFHKGTGEFSF